MGVNYYMLSGATKRIWIDGKLQNVNQIVYSHKVGSYDFHNSRLAAQLSRNATYWNGRSRPKYVIYDGKTEDNDLVQYWPWHAETQFTDRMFFVNAGTIRIDANSLIMIRHQTLLVRFKDMSFAEVYEEVSAFKESLPDVSIQTNSLTANGSLKTFVYFHVPDDKSAVMIKLRFTGTELFENKSSQYL